MKELNLEQMEKIHGGDKKTACKVLNATVYVAGIGTMFGTVAAIIFAPTAIIGGGLSLAFC